MEIVNRSGEFWMEFFDPSDAYKELYVNEDMIIRGIFNNMGTNHNYIFKFNSLEEVYPYIHGTIYAYKDLKYIDFAEVFYEKYNTLSFLRYLNDYIKRIGNLYIIDETTYSIRIDNYENPINIDELSRIFNSNK